MRKVVPILLIFALSLLADLDIESFQAKFRQKIRDDQNTTLVYTGTVHYLSPNLTLWRYETPVEKSVLVDGQKVIVIEPELEQITITRLTKDQNIISLLKNARKIGPTTYKLTVKKRDFFIHADKNGTIRLISFKDDLSNEVEVEFFDIKQNQQIEQKAFEVEIPAHYDRIYR